MTAQLLLAFLLAVWYSFMGYVVYLQFRMVTGWYRWLLLTIVCCHFIALAAVVRLGVYIGSGCVPQLHPIGAGSLEVAQAFLLIWQVVIFLRDLAHVWALLPRPEDYEEGGIPPPPHLHLEVAQLLIQLVAIALGSVLVFRAC